MWMFHPLGFCSIVADGSDPGGCLLARGRVKGDLERLFPDAGRVKTSPGKDYRYRLLVTRDQVATRMAELVNAIGYPNFKNACPDNRHDAYLDVWATMYNLQQGRVKSKRRSRRDHRLRPFPGNSEESMIGCMEDVP